MLPRFKTKRTFEEMDPYCEKIHDLATCQLYVFAAKFLDLSFRSLFVADSVHGAEDGQREGQRHDL